MLFNNYLHEEDETVAGIGVNDIDVMNTEYDIDSVEGQQQMAKEIEAIATATALESVDFFEGGEEAKKHFMESADVQALMEARKMSKNTYVRLNKNDDLTRRAHLASLLLAKNAKDPLWNKLALNRVKERQLRGAIFKKYGPKAKKVAFLSQKEHIKNARKLPALPVIKF